MNRIEKILCPVDFSQGSERAVDYAASLAALTGATVELLHVYLVPVLTMPEGQVTATPAYIAKVMTIAQDEFDKLRGSLEGRNVRVKTTLLDGEPVETILNYARESGASLMVLGTHGWSGFQHFVMGSTAERVVRLSEIPVLTVRNAG
jgi:nucleotide-binding universal stress UspA family protein